MFNIVWSNIVGRRVAHWARHLTRKHLKTLFSSLLPSTRMCVYNGELQYIHVQELVNTGQAYRCFSPPLNPRLIQSTTFILLPPPLPRLWQGKYFWLGIFTTIRKEKKKREQYPLKIPLAFVHEYIRIANSTIFQLVTNLETTRFSYERKTLFSFLCRYNSIS